MQLGDDVFLGGLRGYIRAHANGNASFSDLTAAWSAAGASDIDTWSAAWLRTTGLDELSVRGPAIVRRSENGTGKTHAIAVAAYSSGGTVLASTRVTVASAETPIPAFDGAALVLPDAFDESWVKPNLPAATWQAMPRLLPAIGDTRTRVTIWNALQLATADAEIDPSLGVDIIAAALPEETDDAVIGVIGEWAVRLVGCYLDEAGRAEARRRIAEAMLPVVEVAPAGSSRQLAAARVVIATTSQPQRLLSWLADRNVPAGLAVDTELRWTILARLASLGAVDAATIDSEAARDRSAQGAVHAAYCHAALPDPAAKQAAWDSIINDADRPNYELYALAGGFWHPDQRAFTDAYVPRYFAEIPTTAQLRSGWVVGYVASLAYPWPAVDTTTVDATSRLLADGALAPHIRRPVIDAGDDLRRALIARERFASASRSQTTPAAASAS
jgi:aminopeptidase N